MILKHYSTFNNISEKLDWRDLRNDETEPHYFVPYNKSDYLAKVDTDPPGAVKAIIDQLQSKNIGSLFSIGCGLAQVEFQIKKNSDIAVTITDYNDIVSRLKSFDIFDEVLKFNALTDSLPVGSKCAVLFPRIDTEFNNEQLSQLFEKCSHSDIRNIIFIPANIISYRSIVGEIKIWIYCLLKNRTRVFCGFMRSNREFMKIWAKYYKVDSIYNKERAVYFLKKI